MISFKEIDGKSWAWSEKPLFSVGQKVLVRKDIPLNEEIEEHSNNVVDSMFDLRGEFVTIKNVNYDEKLCWDGWEYEVEECGSFGWHHWMFEIDMAEPIKDAVSSILED